MKIGELVIIEMGEYSDRGWSGPFLVMKEFTFKALKKAFTAGVNEEDLNYSYSHGPSEFMAWLVKEGYIQELEVGVQTVHIGSYGTLEIDGDV